MTSMFRIMLGTTILLVSASVYASCNRVPVEHVESIRIGWQIPWATQGQVVQALKHTNALRLNGLRGEFKGFSYGGPLNEAALAGAVDAIFTADQPAAALLAADGRWTIVARLMYNRTALYVPPKSRFQSLADLKGKRIAMPYGAAAQRVALQALRDAGLDPEKDIQSLNLDILQQANIVRSTDAAQWEGIDALVGFDPTPAIFEQKGLARILYVGRVVSLVLMADDYLARQPAAAERFLTAYIQAWDYYVRHQADANRWFTEEARLDLDQKVLDIAASVEPNIRAKSVSELRPTLTDDDLKVVQEAADFAVANKLARRRVEIANYVNQDLVRSAFASAIAGLSRVTKLQDE